MTQCRLRHSSGLPRRLHQPEVSVIDRPVDNEGAPVSAHLVAVGTRGIVSARFLKHFRGAVPRSISRSSPAPETTSRREFGTNVIHVPTDAGTSNTRSTPLPRSPHPGNHRGPPRRRARRPRRVCRRATSSRPWRRWRRRDSPVAPIRTARHRRGDPVSSSDFGRALRRRSSARNPCPINESRPASWHAPC